MLCVNKFTHRPDKRTPLQEQHWQAFRHMRDGHVKSHAPPGDNINTEHKGWPACGPTMHVCSTLARLLLLAGRVCCCLDIIRLLKFAKKTCNGHCYANCSNGQLGVIWVLVHVCCCASLGSVQLWSERACKPIPVCMFALMLRTRRQSSLASVSFRGRLARRKTEAAVQCAPSGWENLVPWINTLYNI